MNLYLLAPKINLSQVSGKLSFSSPGNNPHTLEATGNEIWKINFMSVTKFMLV